MNKKKISKLPAIFSPNVKRRAGKISVILLLTVFAILGGVLLAFKEKGIPLNFLPFLASPKPESLPQFLAEVRKFTSNEEFKTYVEAAQANSGATGFGVTQLPALREGAPLQGPISAGRTEEARVSETNVQERGIDEPDIVKTDGQRIFLSSNLYYFSTQIRGFEEERGLPPPERIGETKIIKAFPPQELKVESTVVATGELLLVKDRLVVFSGNGILGYDVTNPADPNEKWKHELESRVSVVASRLFQGRLYVVTRTGIDFGRPCPVPLLGGPSPLSIPCTDIYHPVGQIPTDVTYTAMIVDPISGTVEKRITFVGSSADSVVYMSTESLYVTYTNYPDIVTFLYHFYTGVGSDMVSPEVRTRLSKLAMYDISPQAKLTELQYILEKYNSGLSQDERLRLENEMNNRLAVFMKEKARELTTTGIVKVDLNDISITATGTVPGQPLNQFSLDEHDKNLRVAVTFGGGGGWFNFSGNESANDVYVLDGNLKELGSVKGLGIGERIYSVRFIEDRGYVVTFKQIDPFYVLDLSNPVNPQKRGELKIPGFSSYLHPLVKNRILGVGQEGSQVKLSLFDVSNPDTPTEVGKFLIDENWTEVSNNHHAFLQDAKHGIFFIPGGKGAYIFSYTGDQLALVKATSDILPKRAVFINDFLYILAENKIVVLYETDWSIVNQIDL